MRRSQSWKAEEERRGIKDVLLSPLHQFCGRWREAMKSAPATQQHIRTSAGKSTEKPPVSASRLAEATCERTAPATESLLPVGSERISAQYRIARFPLHHEGILTSSAARCPGAPRGRASASAVCDSSVSTTCLLPSATYMKRQYLYVP